MLNKPSKIGKEKKKKINSSANILGDQKKPRIMKLMEEYLEARKHSLS